MFIVGLIVLIVCCKCSCTVLLYLNIYYSSSSASASSSRLLFIFLFLVSRWRRKPQNLYRAFQHQPLYRERTTPHLVTAHLPRANSYADACGHTLTASPPTLGTGCKRKSDSSSSGRGARGGRGGRHRKLPPTKKASARAARGAGRSGGRAARQRSVKGTNTESSDTDSIAMVS